MAKVERIYFEAFEKANSCLCWCGLCLVVVWAMGEEKKRNREREEKQQHLTGQKSKMLGSVPVFLLSPSFLVSCVFYGRVFLLRLIK